MDTENASEIEQSVQPKVDALATRLESLLIAKQPEQALALVNSVENESSVVSDCSDAITTVVKFLTDQNLAQNPKLYNGCEEILKSIASKASEGEVILELLEVIDTTKNDNTVVSILKALQICLLKQRERRARSLEWCLNSVQLYVSDLPLSPELRHRLDSEEEQFLEEQDEVRRIISFYFYLFLFYEPILKNIIANPVPNETHFRNNGLTRRNILTCFVIQLFDEPFACLDLSMSSNDENDKLNSHTNIYTRQCTQSLVNHITQLMVDPLRLLAYGELRARWPYILPETDDSMMNSLPPTDIFLIEEKAPLTGLSVLFYALFAENLLPETTPKVYRTVYIFEMGLYFATNLLTSAEESVRTKGIRLAAKLLENLRLELLSDDTLELEVHTTFLTNLVNVLDSTQVRRNSKFGIELLKNYILKFETIEAKHFHIRRLLQTVDNNKICSFLVTIYKNIIADQLDAADKDEEFEMSPYCCDKELRSLLLEHICIIPDGVETDILKHNDLILAALNILRFLVIRDIKNRTVLWDYISDVQDKFLKPLREALDCSRAHYRLEEKRIQEKKAPEVECEVSTLTGDDYAAMSAENRLQVLSIGQNTFDLIESLMSRLNECIETRSSN